LGVENVFDNTSDLRFHCHPLQSFTEKEMNGEYFYAKIIITAVFVVVMICMICSSFFDEN
jgi:hypothetical protein